MIITKTVVQTVTGTNINHYKNLGYDVIQMQKIDIPIEHLPKNSRCEILASCYNCKNIAKMRFEHYNKCCANQGHYVCIKCCNKKTIATNRKKYGVDYSSQTTESKNKNKQTNLKKYGVENPLQNPACIKKMKKTNLIKYGVEYVSQLEIIQEKCKQTRILNGFQLPDNMRSEWDLYNLNVDKVTRKYTKQLFNTWNGYDYYDSEFIAKNLLLHHVNKDYPTIDHKISIFYGFVNNISFEKIGHIDNLCITKRSLNSKKHRKCETDVILK